MTEEKKGSANETEGTETEQNEDFGSQHLNDALNSFRKGLASLGLFCTEQAFPAAEKAAKEGLKNVEEVLAKAREAMDEAFEKGKGEFSSTDENNNDSTSGQK